MHADSFRCPHSLAGQPAVLQAESAKENHPAKTGRESPGRVTFGFRQELAVDGGGVPRISPGSPGRNVLSQGAHPYHLPVRSLKASRKYPDRGTSGGEFEPCPV